MLAENVTLIGSLIAGLISFFSPCVLPILPLYLSYLAGNVQGETAKKSRYTLLFNTLFFVLGISTTFFILGFGVTYLSGFLGSNKLLFMKLGGILIIFFGISYMDIFKDLSFGKIFKFDFKPKKMNSLWAFLLGFTFSFAWTPCIGVTLSSILVLAASSGDTFTSVSYILVYTLGFALPFLGIALLSDYAGIFLNKIKGSMMLIKRIGGVILIIMGVSLYLGKVGTPSPAVPDQKVEQNNSSNAGGDTTNTTQNNTSKNDTDKYAAPTFSLQDQYGNTYSLDQLKGKVVFLNFFATWCPPCNGEMPHIEKLYQKYKDNKEVVILAIAVPNLGKETDVEGIKAWAKDNNYTLPILMDHNDTTSIPYQIQSYPTTYMITKEGTIYGAQMGAMSYEYMEKIIDMTLKNVENR